MNIDTGWADYFEKPDDPYIEDLNLGGTWLIELVTAVDFLRRGDRHGFTVWDAIEEAVRLWVAERVSTIHGVPDPDFAELGWADPTALARSLSRMLDVLDLEPPVTAAVAMQEAIRRWLDVMASVHNAGWIFAIPMRDGSSRSTE